MKGIWKSSQYNLSTKLKLYRSCFLSTLLCGSVRWHMAKCMADKLSSFCTTCRRKIWCIFWPKKITNSDIHHQCNDMETVVIRLRWSSIGHVLRLNSDAGANTAIQCFTIGKQRRGNRHGQRQLRRRQSTWVIQS